MINQFAEVLGKNETNMKNLGLTPQKLQNNITTNTIQKSLNENQHHLTRKADSKRISPEFFLFSKKQQKNDTKEESSEKIIGGHNANFRILDNGRLIQKKTNRYEYDFYNNMIKDPNNPLLTIIPTPFSTDNSPKNVILMENLTYDLKNPIIIDIKIGTRTARKHDYINEGYCAPIAFIKKEGTIVKDALHGLNKRGFSVVGGNTMSGSRMSKARHSNELLNIFLKNEVCDSKKIDSILKELSQIREVVKNSNYTFIDSSVFIAIDKEQVKMKLVDFARAYPQDDDKSKNKSNFLKYKKRFLYGLDKLILSINKYKTERDNTENNLKNKL